jgi:hypothetical protein
MSAYSDSVSEPVFSEPDSVSAKKNIETEVEIGFFRPFPSVFIATQECISMFYCLELNNV